MSDKPTKKRPMSYLERENKSAEYRGKYIQAVCGIETSLDVAISCHFCKEDIELSREFWSSILRIIPLNTKHEIFRLLASKHYPESYSIHYRELTKSEKKSSPDIKSFHQRVEQIFNTRNKLAHWSSYPSENPYKGDEPNEIIYFQLLRPVHAKITLDSFEISDAKFKEMIKEVKSVTDAIWEIAENFTK
ncbi:MAG: hypothetical protein K1X54_11540 [Flavobacteriales bacterium]|nr:hypothetical protein [Flavobacteriales bacterium]